MEQAWADDGTVDVYALDVFHNWKICCVGFGLLRAAGFEWIMEQDVGEQQEACAIHQLTKALPHATKFA